MGNAIGECPVVDWPSAMKPTFRVERTALCPFCGQPVERATGDVFLTLKRANDCLVYWKIHEKCFIERITANAAEQL